MQITTVTTSALERKIILGVSKMMKFIITGIIVFLCFSCQMFLNQSSKEDNNQSRLIAAFLVMNSNQFSGTFTPTGNMIHARSFHISVKLKNGKVLIAGGGNKRGYSIFSNTAEIYDPDTGQFQATGNMNSPRGMFTATLLNSGKVLVAGGLDGYYPMKSAEIYDPNTGIWTSLSAELFSERYNHSAVLLGDGTVLIAGGAIGTTTDQNPVITYGAEIFDPVTESFTVTNTLNVARHTHFSTLLNDNTAFLFGGITTDNYISNTSEIYNPITSSFSLADGFTPMRAEINQGGTILKDGNVFLAGGLGHGNKIINSVDLFNVTTKSFVPLPSMKWVRASHSVILLDNGNVLVAGGLSTYEPVATGEVFDVANKTWAITRNTMSNSRESFAMTKLDNGLVLVTVGFSKFNTTTTLDEDSNTADLFDSSK